jgi:hypothetical protein
MLTVTTLPFTERGVTVADDICPYCGHSLPTPDDFDFGDHVTMDGVCYDVLGEERIGGYRVGRCYLQAIPLVLVAPAAEA